MNIIILAAGAGTRMHSSKPKVLHCLAGKPMIQHVLDHAKTLNPSRIIIVVGHQSSNVEENIGDKDLVWVKQTHQNGTAHAVNQALPHLIKTEPSLVLYGDVPLVKPTTLRKLSQQTHCLSILTACIDNATGYGRIIRNEADDVVAIVEEKDASDEQKKIREINSGIMFFPPDKLAHWIPQINPNNAQKEYYLTDAVGLALQDKTPIKTCQPDQTYEINGVNNQTQLAALERIYQTQLAHQLMDKGVGLADPQRIDIRGTLRCGKDVFIDIGCIFEGNVTIQDHVNIGSYSLIKNTLIESHTEIFSHCHIDSAKIGQNCSVGPFARIRPETQLDHHAKIGNFVEIKKSHVGQESKINHLSYIGDTTVGQSVNIGAGVITCNYDGKKKSATTIGDHSFIGSSTQMIAPIKIGHRSLIGAGSTLTHDVPDDHISTSRIPQTTQKKLTKE